MNRDATMNSETTMARPAGFLLPVDSSASVEMPSNPRKLSTAIDSAAAIIFGCPTYMGSMSAEMKKFIEVAAKKWFTQAWKDKVAGAFTNSSSFSGDKLNTLLGLVINTMQYGMIYVGLGMMPAASDRDSMNSVTRPGPEVLNRVGSFTGPMAASFQVQPPAMHLPPATLPRRKLMAFGWLSSR